MLSEYQIQCPRCGYLKALNYRELNSRATYIECPKCSLYQECLLPHGNEKLERHLFAMAKSRLKRRAMLDQFRRVWLPVGYVVLVGIYSHDPKLVLILVGMLLMMQSANSLIPMTPFPPSLGRIQ